jgi:hypothetical protein
MISLRFVRFEMLTAIALTIRVVQLAIVGAWAALDAAGQ